MKYLRLCVYLLCLTTPQTAMAICIGLGCTCSVTATNMDFGAYDPFGVADLETQGTLSVTCEAFLLAGLVEYEIQVNAGTNAALPNRSLSNGLHLLDYNLYTDATLTSIWGDNTAGTVSIVDSYLLALLAPQTRQYTIFGRIPGGQNVSAGTYTDTITVTVIY